MDVLVPGLYFLQFLSSLKLRWLGDERRESFLAVPKLLRAHRRYMEI